MKIIQFITKTICQEFIIIITFKPTGPETRSKLINWRSGYDELLLLLKILDNAFINLQSTCHNV